AESHFRGVRAKEIQRRAAGLDVHRLPPGGPRPARVELRGGVETGEIEVDHDDAVDPSPCEGPGNPGPDDATADDEDPHPLHAVRVAETAAPCTLHAVLAASIGSRNARSATGRRRVRRRRSIAASQMLLGANRPATQLGSSCTSLEYQLT